MTVLYPNVCYNEYCYKGTALSKNGPSYCKWYCVKQNGKFHRSFRVSFALECGSVLTDEQIDQPFTKVWVIKRK